MTLVAEENGLIFCDIHCSLSSLAEIVLYHHMALNYILYNQKSVHASRIPQVLREDF